MVRIDDRGHIDKRGHHQVDRSAQPALQELITAAATAGHRLRVQSAYRSYAEQAHLFAVTKEIGRAARPGHSEHQLGTTIDLRLPSTAGLEWLRDRAFSFGFALSYPAGKQRLTGYRPEPWHVRFVGRALAEEIHTQYGSLEAALRARPGLGESGNCNDCPQPSSIAACGAVTEAGKCDGSVLSWCYDGALAAVDCATSEQTCAAAENGQHDCVPTGTTAP